MPKGKTKRQVAERAKLVEEATFEESPIVINVCPGCNGRKFIEFQGGTVCVPCSTCNGTGELINEEPADDNTSEDSTS